MADRKVVKSFLWGTLTGAVAGAVTALLFAPKPGKELRQDIAETAHKVGGKTAEIGREAGAAVQSMARRTSEWVSETKQRFGGSRSAADSSAEEAAKEEQEEPIAL
jgi:gas vesicle protein